LLQLLNQITESIWDKPFPEFLTEGALDQRDAGRRLQNFIIVDIARYWADVVAKLAEEDVRRIIVRSILTDNPDITPDEAVDLTVQFMKNLTSEELNDFVTMRMQQMDVDKVLGTLWTLLVAPTPARGLLVVIDSLNALVEGAQSRFRNFDDRQTLLAVLRSFERWEVSLPERPTIIFTAEDSPAFSNTAAESYIVDVVVELKREERIYKRPITAEESIEWKEDLFFCRVRKGRGLAIQRRSCCYEFVKGVGLKLIPTYAAQGFVSLFYENQPQREVIQNLRTVDVPASYPGVFVQEFTRSALQRMFAVRRYQEQRVPPRQSMLLCHVDEYWVDVLSKANMLYPIPPNELHPFSLSMPVDKSPFITALATAKEQFYLDCDGNYLAVPQMGNVGMLIYRKDLLHKLGADSPPETWEELEEMSTALRAAGMPYRLLLETQTYDTLVMTALELGWSHGAIWQTTGVGDQLEVEFKRGNFDDLVVAIERLQWWIHHDKLVSARCSVDPTIMPAAHSSQIK
jgi:hypothetical protein